MRFTKMHGAGNDYVYIDGFADALPERPDEVARLRGLHPDEFVPTGLLRAYNESRRSRVAVGEDARAGRWRGSEKTECGSHIDLESDGSGI